ncbi:MAG: hypothetical protein KDA92_08975 [Planctomycetales bacterium]|nr:hypothetical protein [Planctomycetales bacterium]
MNSIRKAGGRVFYNFDYKNPGRAWTAFGRQLGHDYFHSVHSVTFGQESTAPLPIETICRQFPSITAIGLDGDCVDDRALEGLSSLSNLESLTLSDATSVTDVGLRHICRIPSLRTLTISGSQVTDDAVGDIWKLPHLKRLILRGNKVSDEMLDGAPYDLTLEELEIADCGVTDRVADHLARMTSLKTILLNRTAVTEDGLETLKTQLPSCFVQVIP